MKKLFVGFLFFTLLFLGIYFLLNQKEFMYSKMSSDGKYTIEVYTYKRFFATPGDGGISSRNAYIKLFDKNGNVIGDTKGCDVFFGDLEINFEITDNILFYSRGNGINLATGSCH